MVTLGRVGFSAWGCDQWQSHWIMRGRGGTPQLPAESLPYIESMTMLQKWKCCLWPRKNALKFTYFQR